MGYKTDKPIYLQIVDTICNSIMLEQYKIDERIVSVRELSITLGVNPNTVARSYEILESQGIIYNKRGIGYFVATEAIDIITKKYQNEFINETLPYVFDRMKLLKINIEEVVKRYK
jgi:DNA-binding transcriptional regulator YhcF (GntR family)